MDSPSPLRESMRVLFLLTYYLPHISGLTIAAANRAEGLAARGHTVRVLSSQNRSTLPLVESLRGVTIERAPVLFRAGKGVWMRAYRKRLYQAASQCDVMVQCLPASPMESYWAASVARQLNKPLLIDYACDLQLAGGSLARAMQAAANWGHHKIAPQAAGIVVATEDYAKHSPFASQYPDKLRIIPLTIQPAVPEPDVVAALRKEHAPNEELLIGFAGRMATEKGLEYLADAVAILLAKQLPVRLLLAGEVSGVIGEDTYRRRMLTKLAALGDRCRVLGVIQPNLSAFYSICDVLALPSLNRTESFGMVQVEAMHCGTPVVASDLPGVRAAVQSTGMGMIAPVGNAAALADALQTVLLEPDRFRIPLEQVKETFSAERSIASFEHLLREVCACP